MTDISATLKALQPTEQEVKPILVPTDEVIPFVAGSDWLKSRIQRPSDLTKYTRTVFYGDPGSRKTVSAARSPKPLIVQIGTETLSLMNHDDTCDLPVVKFEKWQEYDELYWEFRHGRITEFETIVFDNVSEISAMNLDQIAVNAKRVINFQNDYKENNAVLRRLLLRFGELPIHLCVVAHARYDKEGEEPNYVINISPDLPPRLGSTIVGYFDVIGYMTAEISTNSEGVKYIKHQLQTQGTARVKAKNRLSKTLPLVLLDPTMNKIIEAKNKLLQERGINV